MLIMFKANLLKVIVAITMLVFMIPQGTAAAEGLKLAATGEKGGIGDQVIVTIKANNAAGTEGGQFLLTFDSSLVRPVSIEAGDLIAEAKSLLHMGNLEYAPGQLMYMWVTVYADTNDSGNVCEIKFDLLKEGETLLRFDEIVVVPDVIGPAASVPGKINISTGAAGANQEESEPVELDQDPDQDLEDTVVSDNDRDVNEDSIDESINGKDSDNNLSAYAIGLVALVFLSIIGYFMIKRLKKPGSKKKKTDK